MKGTKDMKESEGGEVSSCRAGLRWWVGFLKSLNRKGMKNMKDMKKGNSIR